VTFEQWWADEGFKSLGPGCNGLYTSGDAASAARDAWRRAAGAPAEAAYGEDGKIYDLRREIGQLRREKASLEERLRELEAKRVDMITHAVTDALCGAQPLPSGTIEKTPGCQCCATEEEGPCGYCVVDRVNAAREKARVKQPAPTPGRIVHWATGGEWHPLLVTGVWEHEEEGMWRLSGWAFFDPNRQGEVLHPLPVGACKGPVEESDAKAVENRWCWPPRAS